MYPVSWSNQTQLVYGISRVCFSEFLLATFATSVWDPLLPANNFCDIVPYTTHQCSSRCLESTATWVIHIIWPFANTLIWCQACDMMRNLLVQNGKRTQMIHKGHDPHLMFNIISTDVCQMRVVGRNAVWLIARRPDGVESWNVHHKNRSIALFLKMQVGMHNPSIFTNMYDLLNGMMWCRLEANGCLVYILDVIMDSETLTLTELYSSCSVHSYGLLEGRFISRCIDDIRGEHCTIRIAASRVFSP